MTEDRFLVETGTSSSSPPHRSNRLWGLPILL